MDSCSEERLGSLLAKAGLGHLFAAFLKEKITVDLIPHLTPPDLEKLGISHVGERVMLLSLAKEQEKEKKIGGEMRRLFGHGKPEAGESSSPVSSLGSVSNREGLIARADQLCKHLRRKGGTNYKKSRRSTQRSVKEIQKGLVLIDFQGSDASDISLREYDRLYDGSIRYLSDWTEDDIRNEIVRLLKQKQIVTHNLDLISPEDFDFVRCVNRQVKIIDGDTPFDANGISQVYKNGYVYVRLNTSIIEVSTKSDSELDDVDDLPPPPKFNKTDDGAKPPEGQLCVSPKYSEHPSGIVDGDNNTTSIEVIDVDADDESDVALAIQRSKVTAAAEARARDEGNNVTPRHDVTPRSLVDVLNTLKAAICEDTFDMVVRRDYVLTDALSSLDRLSFDPQNKLNVTFVGENGTDGGGLTREFFTVLIRHCSKYIEPTGCFKHNSFALQDRVYFKLGQLLAMALVHGGSAVYLLSLSVFNFICGMKPLDIVVDIDEIPEADIREIVTEISSASTPDNLRTLVLKNIDLIIEAGVTKPYSKITMDDKFAIVQSVALQRVILKTLAELTQFREGFQCLGVGKMTVEHSSILQQFYVNKMKPKLTADIIRKLFTKKFSDAGSNARTREESAYMNFLKYLYECERADSEVEFGMDDEELTELNPAKENALDLQLDPAEKQDCNVLDPAVVDSQGPASCVALELVMYFFSGACTVPPAGYDVQPIMYFSDENIYPTASTCAIQLILPTKYSDYESFKKALNTAFLMHGGFGLS